MASNGKVYDWITFSVNEEVDVLTQARFVAGGHAISNAYIKPMLVEGTVAPTEYKKYDTTSDDISKLQSQLNGLTLHPCSKADYDAMESHDANTLYVCWE